MDGNAPANGTYDLTFSLFPQVSGGALLAGPLTNSATAVSNGLFSVSLDFGSAFDGNARWLELSVRSNGLGTFATLTPRQPLSAVPYAITAGGASNLVGSLAAGQISGTLPLTSPT